MKTGIPFSYNQRQFWILQQIYPASSAYNVGSCFRIRGIIDRNVLDSSLRLLWNRHEILRWRCVPGVDPVLHLEESSDPLWEEVHLTKSPDAQELPFDVVREIQTPFNLETDRLTRVRLFVDANKPVFLTITIHHLLCDLRSKDIIAEELGRVYQQICSGQSPIVEQPPMSYANFSRWQNNWVSTSEFKEKLRYWTQDVAGVLPLDWSTDFPYPPFPTLNGNSIPLCFSPTETRRIRQAAGQATTNAYLLLLTSYVALLSRVTRSPQICIGVPLSNRRTEEYADTVGCFVSIVPLVVDCSGTPSMLELLGRVRRKMLGAHRHQEVPFELVAREAAGNQGASRNPLFQAGFTFEHPMRLDLHGAQLEPIHVHRGGAQLECFVTFWEEQETIEGYWEYNSDLFARSSAQALATSLKMVALSMADDPSQLLDAIPLIEKTRAGVYGPSVLPAALKGELRVDQLIRERSKICENSLAVVAGEQRLHYRELMSQVDGIRELLSESGVRGAESVGLCLDRSALVPATIIALWELDAAYIPLDPEYPQERTSFMLHDSGARLVVTEEKYRERFASTDLTTVCVDSQTIVKRSNPFEIRQRDGLAYVMYTSGSTGKPKGVMIPHHALVNFLLSMSRAPGIAPDDSLLAVTTISFDISLLELFLPLISGAHVVIAPRTATLDPQELARLAGQSRTTMMQATPVTWRMLVGTGWQPQGKFKALCGGEALPRDLMRTLLTRCSEVWNMYGPTETTVWSTCHRCSLSDETVCIGSPIDNTSLYILDDKLQPLPRGVRGELFIGGLGVARGYLDRPELTSGRFLPDPFDKRYGAQMYRTGDICRFREGDIAEYCERSDNQVKIRGFRIEPAEIDAALQSHPAVTLSATIVRENARGEKTLVSYVVPRDDVHIHSVDMRDHLKHSLPLYMVPSSIVEIPTLPLTPNGKIDRKALPDPSEVPSMPNPMSIDFKEGIEKHLGSIWQEVVGTAEFGPSDNFFDIGGSSIALVEVGRLLRDRLGISLAATTLFQYPTVRALATFLNKERVPEAGTTGRENARSRAELQRQALSRYKGRRRPS